MIKATSEKLPAKITEDSQTVFQSCRGAVPSGQTFASSLLGQPLSVLGGGIFPFQQQLQPGVLPQAPLSPSQTLLVHINYQM